MIWQNTLVHDLVALLRGVNVGGNRMIPMKDLRDSFSRAGFESVETLLQSGNVIVRSDCDVADTERRMQAAAEVSFGVRLDIHIRTAAEWDQLTKSNPMPGRSEEMPSRVLVTFFRESVDPKYVEALRAFQTGDEEILSVDRELYIAYPNGILESKLDRMPGWSKYAVTGTARNWNTVMKIQRRLEVRSA